MIKSLLFVKTATINNTINHALQSVPTNSKSKKHQENKQRLDKLQAEEYISLDDAQFIVKLLNDNHSHDHKHYAHELLKGCELYKEAPKITKTPKFEAYLKTLRAKYAQREYEKMINSNKPKDKSVWSNIRDERGAEQWLEMSNIGHLLMVMVGSFLVFFYLAHHLYPDNPEYRLAAGAVGLLLGLAVEYALLVVREERTNLESTAKTADVNAKKQHQKYNEKSLQQVIDGQDNASQTHTCCGGHEHEHGHQHVHHHE